MLNAIMTFKYENVFPRFKNSSLIDIFLNVNQHITLLMVLGCITCVPGS